MTRTEHTGTTDRVDWPGRFEAVRGSAHDEAWAQDAWLALVLRGRIDTDHADAALGEVLDLVRESGEGPLELYGPADEWAAERVAQWAAEGSDAIADEATRWRDAPVVAAVMAVVLSLLMGVARVLEGEWTIDWTLGWILLPFLGPFVMVLTTTAWERTVTRRPMAVGALVAGVVFAAGIAGLTTLIMGTNPHPVAHASIAWAVPLAVVYGVLAWLLDRLAPATPPADGPVGDDAWAGDLARILRSRGDTTESQVARIVDEARAHAAASGGSLAAEFGSPAAYAAQVSPRPVVRARRSALYRVGMLALAAWVGWGVLGDTQAWPAKVLFVIAIVGIGYEAARALWRYAVAARAERAGR